MLCSCCVTPVVVTLLRRRVRVGSAIALLLASPVLNPAALVLTFLLFPLHLGVARLSAACVLAIAVPRVVQWRIAYSSGRDYLLHDEFSMLPAEAWPLVSVVRKSSGN